jgi:hypothetical protein
MPRMTINIWAVWFVSLFSPRAEEKLSCFFLCFWVDWISHWHLKLVATLLHETNLTVLKQFIFLYKSLAVCVANIFLRIPQRKKFCFPLPTSKQHSNVPAMQSNYHWMVSWRYSSLRFRSSEFFSSQWSDTVFVLLFALWIVMPSNEIYIHIHTHFFKIPVFSLQIKHKIELQSIKSRQHCILKNRDIYYSQHETLPQTCTEFCDKHNINISLMWANDTWNIHCNSNFETLTISNVSWRKLED